METETQWTPPAQSWGRDFKGLIPESWLCIDCGVNTAPGLLNRVEKEAAVKALGALWDLNLAGVKERIDHRSEVYTVRHAIWKRAGVAGYGGCLCIGCLETRLGRALRPKDFLRDHPFNSLPGTPRLLKRRG